MPRRRLPRHIRIGPLWRRRPGWLVLLILVSLAAGWLQYRQPPRGDDAIRYHDKAFAVARVIDGDTLDIHAPDNRKPVTRIRLWGVDAPELGRGKQQPMHFGQRAADYVAEMLAGKTVHLALSPDRTRGKYGRLLAYVYLDRDGPMLNEMLIKGGYAYADPRFPHHYRDRFIAIEKRAQRDRVGLWKDVTPPQMPAWRRRLQR